MPPALQRQRLGFVKGGSEAERVACGLTRATKALKPSQLRRRLESKHSKLAGELGDIFTRKENGFTDAGKKRLESKNEDC